LKAEAANDMSLLRKYTPKFLRSIYRSIYAKSVLRYNMTKDYPVDINFELTTACNLKCKYCPRHELVRNGIRSVGNMDYDLMSKIIRDLSKISDRKFSISPVGLGEPLLYPEIYDVLRLLRNRFQKAHIHINTNALLLDKDFSKELIETRLELMI
jgi:MoaA/NifB/PqqE/SkfB family radical SAM enzyme